MGSAVRRVLSCLVVSALAGCAGAAMEGANMAKDEAVYQNNIEAARAGDRKAEFRVGSALCCSLGDREGFYNTREAVEWLCRSSEQGYAPASRKLGQVYSGHVVEGVRLLRRVAERVSGRQEDLAVSYAWLRVAGSQGAAEAEEDASELWAELSEADRAKARGLLAGNQPPPCRWNEVFPS